jgi:hypothetical protein
MARLHHSSSVKRLSRNEAIMSLIFDKATNFIWENARRLERAIFDFRFRGGSPKHIVEILRTYQNDDGGFGQALEPDLRAPDSQPLFVEFALRTLYDCDIRDTEMAYRACDFLSRHADIQKGIPAIFPHAKQYPHAAHMSFFDFDQPTLDRLTSLVGLLAWQGVDHPWLKSAVNACLEHISRDRMTDANILQNAFCLVECLPDAGQANIYFKKLAYDLFQADFFILDVPIKTYGLTPLSFAPSPDSYCRKIFTDAQIESHLNELISQQSEDGGWPILWEPPAGTARLEWRAYKTVMALLTLKAYERI